MFIFGTTTAERETGTGTFFCPTCCKQRTYRRLAVGQYLSVLAIPLFRTRVVQEYARCRSCQGAFTIDSLGLQVPTVAHWTPERIRIDLESGTALEIAFAKLMYCGMEENVARRMIAMATGDICRFCSDCNLSFVSTVKRCSNCTLESREHPFEEKDLQPRAVETAIRRGAKPSDGVSQGFQV